MKKLVSLLLGSTMVMSAFAGGMQHNTNQSAQWVRSLNRDASTEIDAVYFNPAGLTMLDDGFHFSLNSQTLKQTRTIKNTYPLLNYQEYEGTAFVPVLPSLFAAYKVNKLVFSAGFMVIAGGGKADFDKGVPSFEIPISQLPAALNSKIPTDNYSVDMNFAKSSAYYGIQGGISYELTEMLSLYVGARYVLASGPMNTLKGSISNIMINPTFGPFDGSMTNASQFFTAIGKDTLAQATADKKIDVEQSGSGVTPIIGVNLNLMESRLNIGLKYEFATEIVLENKTIIDQSGMFPDKVKQHSDLPAMFSAGVDFQATEKLGVSLGYHQYFDKDVHYFDDSQLNSKFLDGNAYEYSIGLEYILSDKLLLSAGYLSSVTQKKLVYQSDMANNLTSSSIGLGGQYKITDNLDVNVGFLMTIYKDETVTTTTKPPFVYTYNETFGRDNLLFAIGIGYRITK